MRGYKLGTRRILYIKSKIVFLALFFMLLSSLCICGVVLGHLNNSKTSDDIIYVSASIGDDNNDGLTEDKPKKTIKNATELVSEGGTVKVADSFYTGEKNRNIYINKNIHIEGQNKNKTVIDAQNQNQIFIISPKTYLTLNQMTLTHGKKKCEGGTILNEGCLIVNDCIIKNSPAYGGAIFNKGKCEFTGCTFKNNTAEQEDVGAITNEGDLTIAESDITDRIYTSGNCNVSDSKFTGSELGGRIQNWYGNLNVEKTKFTGTAHGNSGVINARKGTCTIINSIFKNNRDNSVFNHEGNCTIKSSKFINNKGQSGGALTNENEGVCNVIECTFTQNIAIGVNIDDPTNYGIGGAILNNGLPIGMENYVKTGKTILNIYKCNFTKNTASGNKSGSHSSGGAIYNMKAFCIINGCNFIGNTADEGGAISNDDGGVCSLRFNRIVDNTAKKGSNIFNTNGNVDALYNWWGSNKGPLESNVGNVNDRIWLLLSLKAAPNQISVGESSQITADLYTDSNGNNHHEEHDKYPPIIPTIFTSTWGNINQKLMKYAIANTFFTAKGNKYPPSSVSVSVADEYKPTETVTTQIKIKNTNPQPIPHKTPENYINMQYTGLPLLLIILAIIIAIVGLIKHKKT